MAEFPALPLFTDAYLADTRHLTTVQHGAYLLLLMEAWRRPACSLPDDDVLLARLTGLLADDWQANKNAVLAFWERDDRTKTWTQKRLSKERSYVKKTSYKQRTAAKSRWNKEKDVCQSDAKRMPERCQTDAPTPTPTPTDIDSVRRARENPDDLKNLETLMRHAAGWENEPHPNLAVTGSVTEAIKAGVDPEIDLIPAVQANAPKLKNRTSWNYLIACAVTARDQRLATITAVNSPAKPGPHSHDRYRNSQDRRRDDINAALDKLDERVAAGLLLSRS
jgi:uncharacterized protein YdaU (DUF1376 family)